MQLYSGDGNKSSIRIPINQPTYWNGTTTRVVSLLKSPKRPIDHHLELSSLHAKSITPWLLSSTFVICRSSKTGQNYSFSKWLIYFVCKSTNKTKEYLMKTTYLLYNIHQSSVFFKFEIPPSQSGF